MESKIIYVFPTCFIIKYLQVHHKDWPEKLESMSLKSSYILLYWPVIYNSSFFVRKVESNIRVMSIHSILNDNNSGNNFFSAKNNSVHFLIRGIDMFLSILHGRVINWILNQLHY